MLQVPFVEIRHCQDAVGLCQPLIRRRRNCLSGLNKLVSGTWTAKTHNDQIVYCHWNQGMLRTQMYKQASFVAKRNKYDRNNLSAFVEAIRVSRKEERSWTCRKLVHPKLGRFPFPMVSRSCQLVTWPTTNCSPSFHEFLTSNACIWTLIHEACS